MNEPRLRASTEGFPILYTSIQGSGQGCPLLRASNEHCFIVRVLRARRAPGRSFPILLLQSAVGGVPREALEREGARFLFPDYGGSDGTDDLNSRIAFDSSKR